MCIRDRFRRRRLGFVFQDFNLLNTLSVRENIALPLALDGVHSDDIERRVELVAVRLGISHILDKRTYEISGGEQQRAAIGRAICLLYTSPSPRDRTRTRMPSSA